MYLVPCTLLVGLNLIYGIVNGIGKPTASRAIPSPYEGKICLVVFCSPEELKRVIDEAIGIYNSAPRESLANVSPNDGYAGRKEEMLRRRIRKRNV